MRSIGMIILAVMVTFLAGCAVQLGMNPPQSCELKDVKQHPYSAGLFMPKETREYVFVKPTTLYNYEMTYPLGPQTALALQKNLPKIFKELVEVDSLNPPQPVKVVIQPSIIDFKSNIPYPAYNPYTASIVYRFDVYNLKGEKIYSQTVTGDGQTSKGLMSGFVQKGLYAEAAKLAIDKAIQQIVEGLAFAEELKEVN